MLSKIKLLSRLPGNIISYYNPLKKHTPLPINLTLSLLYSCNSRCKTCNVYKKKVDNFSVEEYDKTLFSIGNIPYWFTLSGGEPFLRPDIVDICKVVYKRSKPGIINIPTNGSLYKITPARVEEILKNLPDTEIVINLSLDAIGEKHDEIRGFNGSWKRAMETYKALKELKRFPNLTLGIHTVISVFNVNEFDEIYNELIKFDADSYITEIAEERVELDTIGEKITPDIRDYERAVNFLLKKMQEKENSGVAKIAGAFRIHYYELVKRYLKEKRQIIPCYAGIASAQISPDGDVWPCCIRADSMGNLRENNYNFSQIWHSERAIAIRKSIRNKDCFCPLANATYTNLLHHAPSLTKIAAKLI